MKVGRILETALYAEDLEAAEIFYTKVLGLEVHAREAGHHVFFRSGPNMFLIFNPNATEKEAPGPFQHGSRGRGHVAWAATPAELDDWQRWLEKHGVAVQPYLWPEGGRSLYFSDPAGNNLELATPQVWKIT